ncbi:MAG: DUF1833 family protein [Bradyrhizobium sp.]|uniref:DUF1833 family protein n=1 Tax=Bradyrhizobium sp. TaxID=376 RepID=UPI003D1397A5
MRVPLSARESMAEAATGDTPIILVEITGGDLEEPIRLAADWTEAISLEPLMLGVRHQGETYYFLMLDVDLPSDEEDEPASGSLIASNVTAGLLQSMAEVSGRLTVSLKVIFASDPDADVQPDRMFSESYDADLSQGTVTLNFSREDDQVEPGLHATTKGRCEGLYP